MNWVVFMGENVENFVDEKQKEIIVHISPDDMEVTINIPVVYESDVNPYVFSREEILESLSQKDVKVGIDKELIEKIVEEREYGRDIIVAKGESAVDGVDARFDFCFDTNLTSKPTIREDGTAD